VGAGGDELQRKDSMAAPRFPYSSPFSLLLNEMAVAHSTATENQNDLILEWMMGTTRHPSQMYDASRAD
jgi:hypothetical protein